MNNSRFTRLLLQPSLASILTATGMSFCILFISGFSFATKNNLFYDYLFGSGSSAILIETSRSSIAAFNETVFGNPTLNTILFFVFWMAIGLIVYVFLSGLGSGVSSAEHAMKEANFVHADKLRLGSEFGLKTVLRIIGVSLLFVLMYVIYKLIIPFGVLCARILTGDLRDATNWLYGLLGFTVLALSFHLATIFIRFIMLKPRVFGGFEDIIQDEAEHKSHVN